MVVPRSVPLLLALGLVGCHGGPTDAPAGATVRLVYAPTWGSCPAIRQAQCGHDLAPAGFAHARPSWLPGAVERLDAELIVPASRDVLVAVTDELKACCLGTPPGVTEIVEANGVRLTRVATLPVLGTDYLALRLRVAADGTVTP